MNYDIIAALSAMNAENYVNPNDPIVMAEMPEKNTPERLLLWKEKITSMTEEAQQVIYILLNAPQELIDLIPKNKEFITPRLLRNYLGNKGLTHRKILKIYSEIIKMLREKQNEV